MLRAAFAAPAVVTFDVTSTLDDVDDDAGNGTCHTSPSGPAAGLCTLRAAVMEANRTSAPSATIVLPPGIYTLTIPSAGFGGDVNGSLDLTNPVGGNPLISVLGAGAARTIIDGNQLDRVFRVYANRTALIAGLTIRHGYFVAPQGDGGGGILNLGTLTVTESVISDNQAYSGGGFENWRRLTVLRSTISHNVATDGGGITNYGNIANGGFLTVTQSTISHNWARLGGGGIFNAGPLTLIQSTISYNDAADGGGIAGVSNSSTGLIGNSTISQNNASATGGGFFNSAGTMNVYNTSILFNQADADADYDGTGGGVDNNLGATFNVRNVLLAGNYVSGAPVLDDCRGTLVRYGWSLIGTDAGSVLCSLTGSGSSGYLNSLSLLGPLQNNGGPTWTHALLKGSNTIDGGDPVQGCIDENAVPLATDQRGAARPVGVRCDVGAFEYRPPLYLPLIRR